VIYECQRSLEEIGHAKLDQEARSWARGMGWNPEAAFRQRLASSGAQTGDIQVSLM